MDTEGKRTVCKKHRREKAFESGRRVLSTRSRNTFSELRDRHATSIIRFFKDLEKKYPATIKIHVILDNARYHHAQDVQNYVEKSRIQLVWLPSYSPNLNLIERLWKMFKEHVTYNKYYPTFEEFKEKTIKFFHQRSGSFKEKVMSLLSERFHLFPAIV